MISNNIDGSAVSSGGGQFFDVLAVIANPEAYASRMRELTEATERNKTYVELVAPASDILALREQSKADAEATKRALANSQVIADKIVSDAKLEAASIIEAAKLDAKAARDQAAANAKKVKSEDARIEAGRAKLDADAAALADATVALDRRDADTVKALSEAEALKAEYAEKIAGITSKHRAFLSELA